MVQIARGGSAAAVGGSHVLNPHQARAVVAGATHSMLHAIHTLGLLMTVAPLAAAVFALVLLRPAAAR
ncbi:hypothetical protein A5700_18140 [Mycobacterium sp. E1214]|nr:hypothetical protein A5700_18140 [Mycobacterium sp. E1214]OBH26131.1 hypothetical protein A5693_04515 [Mycobacterium sp. E1319]